MQPGTIKYKPINRNQGLFMELRPDELIDSNHAARLIWQLTGKFDLTEFEADIHTFEGAAGSPCWPPRLLLSVWLYAYQQGIASAREIERRMAWEPGFRWLCGLEVINVHTLCDFRVTRKEKVESLLVQMLSLLSGEGLVDLRSVLQDGTKMQARAGNGSARTRGALEKNLEEARRYVRQLDTAAQKEGESTRTRKEAAQARAERERGRRLDAAFAALQKHEQQRGRNPAPLRVSASEPDAQRMRHRQHGGWLHSYNVQFSSETSNNFIVGVSVTQDHNDTQQLKPAIETIERFAGQRPERIIADNGYVTRESVEQAARAGVELIAPVRKEDVNQTSALKTSGIAAAFARSKFTQIEDSLVCPVGQKLSFITQKRHHAIPVRIYQAAAPVCQACPQKPQCCPSAVGRGRQVEIPVESAAMQEHMARMKTERAQALYSQRSQKAEFPNMRIKANWNLRRFSVWGQAKASIEALWMVLAFNFSQWIWARKRQQAGI